MHGYILYDKNAQICIPWFLDIITTDKLKFRPIIAQTGTYTQNATQVIAEYLKPLVDEKPYIICTTQYFPSIFLKKTPLQPSGKRDN